MSNPIGKVRIVSLPEDYDMYQEMKDEKSGKISWKID